MAIGFTKETQMPQWSANQIELRDIGALNPYERNPRQHPATQIEQIKNSIRQWGWTVPILIDEDNVVLAGHGRLEAAMEMGIDEVPCVVAEGWSEEQKSAYVIADNRLAENSQWDTGIYYSEIKALDDIGFDLTLTGLDTETISALSFEPTLKPMTDYQDVTEHDMNIASETVGEIRPHSQKIIELTCPHCGEDFEFSGQ